MHLYSAKRNAVLILVRVWGQFCNMYHKNLDQASNFKGQECRIWEFEPISKTNITNTCISLHSQSMCIYFLFGLAIFNYFLPVLLFTVCPCILCGVFNHLPAAWSPAKLTHISTLSLSEHESNESASVSLLFIALIHKEAGAIISSSCLSAEYEWVTDETSVKSTEDEVKLPLWGGHVNLFPTHLEMIVSLHFWLSLSLRNPLTKDFSMAMQSVALVCDTTKKDKGRDLWTRFWSCLRQCRYGIAQLKSMELFCIYIGVKWDLSQIQVLREKLPLPLDCFDSKLEGTVEQLLPVLVKLIHGWGTGMETIK